ncbi:unnamed protein product [Thelazia callipaeda]|uniref:ASXH domain-containing protein n=1 Tax=Thelazia callipaeda TaxID=103827 RepID=A0A0N5CRJ5_THECL|nr:unnamed protein product [Thelazia callipaeda]
MADNAMSEKAKNSNLECSENIAHRKSPDLFPENVPGAWDMHRTLTAVANEPKTNRFRTELDPQDVRLVNELGQFSADQLMEYVRSLQNSAYTLGVEEAKQFSKGRFLRVFEKRSEEVSR